MTFQQHKPAVKKPIKSRIEAARADREVGFHGLSDVAQTRIHDVGWTLPYVTVTPPPPPSTLPPFSTVASHNTRFLKHPCIFRPGFLRYPFDFFCVEHDLSDDEGTAGVRKSRKGKSKKEADDSNGGLIKIDTTGDGKVSLQVTRSLPLFLRPGLISFCSA